MKVGMILLKGINDEAYKVFIEKQKKNEVINNPNLNQW
jgi:hypothetical protein